MIVKALDLSTSHIPANARDWMDSPESQEDGPRRNAHEYGWIVFVSEHTESVPKWLLPIWKYANQNECMIINFDSDAEVDTQFDTYDGE